MPDQKQKHSFHFVTFDDASSAPGRKTSEKSRARAHAARVTHQRRKQKRGQTVVKWIVQGPDSRAIEVPTRENDQALIPHVQSSPLSLLSQDKVDPFGTNPHTTLPKQLRSILEYAYECIHPKVISTASEEEVSMIKISWRRIGQEWPVMFDLQVAAAANLVRADVNNDALPNDIELLRREHQGRGLAMVSKELSKVNKLKAPALDALIMAQIMVALLTDPTSTQHIESFRRSPLATAQNLHLYARLKIVPSMIQALLILVRKRGGIKSMREYGNSQMLQFADLMISSRLGIPPSFPWLHPSTSSILKGPRYHPDYHALMMSRVICTGFEQLDPIDVNLANILRTAGEITVALDHYQECRPNAPSLTDLVNAANETHHKLLEIGPKTSFEPSSRTDCLWNVCRLAGLIYSDFVLFPLPATTEVRPRLVRELHHAMEQLETFEAAETAQGGYGNDIEGHNLLVLWTLMLGGLASLNTPNKPYFLQKLQEYSGRVSYVSDWQTFSNLMSTYLWWDYILEEPATRLWMEVAPPSLLPGPQNQPSDFTASLYQNRLSPTSLPVLSHHRNTMTDLGSHGLPTPASSEQSPQPPIAV